MALRLTKKQGRNLKGHAMKKTIKILALILVAAMILCLAACGKTDSTKATEQTTAKKVEIKIGEYLYKTLGDENLEKIQKNLPIKVTFYLDQIGYAKVAEFTEPADIQKIVDMFVKIKVEGKNDIFETDQYNNITFEFSDGSKSKIPLCAKNLEVSTDNDYCMYTLENFDELWEFLESNVKDVEGIDADKETEAQRNDAQDGVVPIYDQETVEGGEEEILETEEITEEIQEETEENEIPEDEYSEDE